MMIASKGDHGVGAEGKRVEEVELGLSLGGGWGSGVALTMSTMERHRGVVAAEGFCSLGSMGSTLSAGSSVSSSGGLEGEEVSGGDGRADEGSDGMVRSANLTSQVVGWPPIRTCRRNNLHNLSRKSTAKAAIHEEISQSCSSATKKGNGGNEFERKTFCQRNSNFVKVKMDGDPIGRKVDLNTHFSYESLALALEAMFHKPTLSVHASTITDGMVSKPLDHSSEFILIYEDEDGDWMLVGDVPWGMFLRTVRRLRIMKTIDASCAGEELNT
ncbi:hypothetical protein HPP92_025684 [Vanilla planifolia]|uniref:Auxin-responsive protein n=1 Tax=Vanilla planifolia TaxID=51239 RepID=A0A835PL23_VANPL|nr:hypothetical protein HPP92_025958 [Vanilla planifolia]KAG0454380.1 hypothetical protein HPP92_025684 [Vanilla planifolia]